MRTINYVFKNGFATKDFAEAETLKATLGCYRVSTEDIPEPACISKKKLEMWKAQGLV